MVNPYKITGMFEEAVAEYCGSKYAVATDSCTSAIFLSLMCRGVKGIEISIPRYTYPGVACSIIHSGNKVKFASGDWEGEYHLSPTGIWDAALRFKRGMYHGGFQCLSFHIKKLLPIGRGGMILTNEEGAYEWFKKARFDGRNAVPLEDDNFTMLGWNCYLDPANAARGLQLLQALGARELEDLKVGNQKYADLSLFKIYTQ